MDQVVSLRLSEARWSVAMSAMEGGYSQASLTFLDTDIGFEFGGDTQGDGFEHYDFTLPSQSTQTQSSQLTQQQQGGGASGTGESVSLCVCVCVCFS